MALTSRFQNGTTTGLLLRSLLRFIHSITNNIPIVLIVTIVIATLIQPRPCHAVCQQTNLIENRRSGYIVSEGYPDKYLNESRCAWRIKVAPKAVIRFFLTVNMFELCSSCSCDYVDIYDGPTTASRRLIRACKSGYTDKFTTTSNVGFVVFHTDSGGIEASAGGSTVKGFHIQFEQVTEQSEIKRIDTEKVKAEVVGKLWAEQFKLGNNLISWRDDLKDPSSLTYQDTKQLFESSVCVPTLPLNVFFLFKSNTLVFFS